MSNDRMIRLAGLLMAVSAVLHATQLVIYPVNFKWWVALAGALIYGAAAGGALSHTKWGVWMCLSPIIGGIFAISVLYFGPPAADPNFKFNAFTVLATIVEIPATAMAIVVLAKGQ